MDNRELFQKTADGYDCEQVERYVAALKIEYKKVFDYAKAAEANNEKLKSICRTLSEENKAFKASGASPSSADADYVSVLERADKISRLGEEIEKEISALRAALAK